MRRDLIERYRDRLHGVLSCYDRIVVTGTLPQACYAEGMTAFLKAQGVRIFDYPRLAEPLRDALRARAQELATSAGITIEHISKAHIRKEDVVAKVLERRGDHYSAGSRTAADLTPVSPDPTPVRGSDGADPGQPLATAACA